MGHYDIIGFMSKATEPNSDYKNKLICGDNLEVLTTLPANSVDLIYLDPPFFSNRNYEIIWGDEAEIRSFVDRWDGGIEVYIAWMKERVQEMYRVLKPTGSLYLHCDWHASHYLKVMLDGIFGRGNFVNEIVWCYASGGTSKKHFSKKHDTILFYSKSNKYKFNVDELREAYSSPEKVQYKIVNGKKYLRKNPLGRVPLDWWEMPILTNTAKERTGYPTQKPEALLERIIKVSSNKGDVVLDPFCGCGTSMAVAQKLDRKWVGIDISPSAIALIKNRFAKPDFVKQPQYTITGMPTKDEDVRRYDPYEFQYWVVNEMYGYPSDKKSRDMGIDGLDFGRSPIQVKQSDHVGRKVVDEFETAIRRYYGNDRRNKQFGTIVAFSFTKDAKEEVARVNRTDGIKIELLTVDELINDDSKKRIYSPRFHSYQQQSFMVNMLQ